VKPLVGEVIAAVQKGPASDCELVKRGVVAWKGDDQISIAQGALISGQGYAQTIAGRRKRFRIELERRMNAIGWRLEIVQRSMVFRKA
jgi:hypothetical protein